eukprot:CAMPEP_0171021652 /NCGR_PEP_ID=MMETSP0736-20130129/30806_1 /TAXON_ID=186038 /ORGANISM="Fragilariopsis kerguelensis, Strain L26-C5" /LENGTH=196 /DNA_ID=CAMNT_0011460021 /DNA_START=326 /DNA_END=916 /DNA_ORIENTATION=+
MEPEALSLELLDELASLPSNAPLLLPSSSYNDWNNTERIVERPPSARSSSPVSSNVLSRTAILIAVQSIRAVSSEMPPRIAGLIEVLSRNAPTRSPSLVSESSLSSNDWYIANDSLSLSSSLSLLKGSTQSLSLNDGNDMERIVNEALLSPLPLPPLPLIPQSNKLDQSYNQSSASAAAALILKAANESISSLSSL